MSSRAVLAACCAAVLCASSRVDAQSNVLLVVLDDVGVDKVAAYGEHPTPGSTPTLDALAAEGVLFRNAWAHESCSPTRAGILTGRHPFRHGVGTWIDPVLHAVQLDADETSLADVLAARGYRTALVGKWHLSSSGAGGDPYLHPLEMGFESHRGPLANLPKADGPGAYFAYERVVDGAPGWSTGYATTDQVDDALELIEAFGDDPWFLLLGFSAAHIPLHPPPAQLHGQTLTAPRLAGGASASGGSVPGVGAPTGATAGVPGAGAGGGSGTPMPSTPGLPSAGRSGLQQLPLPTTDAHAPVYVKAMVEALDTELGRLLDELPAAVRDDTIVIVVGDNGTEGSAVEPPWDGTKAKGTMFEPGIRVPFVVSGPGVLRGGESEALVHTTDLFATVAELAGGDGSTGLDSTSLVAQLADPSAPGPDVVFTERFRPNGPGPYAIRERVARDERFKLVRREIDDVWVNDLLFDLEADPGETVDLADPAPLDPAALAALLELSAVIEAAE